MRTNHFFQSVAPLHITPHTHTRHHSNTTPHTHTHTTFPNVRMPIHAHPIPFPVSASASSSVQHVRGHSGAAKAADVCSCCARACEIRFRSARAYDHPSAAHEYTTTTQQTHALTSGFVLYANIRACVSHVVRTLPTVPPLLFPRNPRDLGSSI